MDKIVAHIKKNKFFILGLIFGPLFFKYYGLVFALMGAILDRLPHHNMPTKTKRSLRIFFIFQVIGTLLFGYYGMIIFGVVGLAFVGISESNLFNKKNTEGLELKPSLPGIFWIVSMVIGLVIYTIKLKHNFYFDHFNTLRWLESTAPIENIISKIVPAVDYYTEFCNNRGDPKKAQLVRHLFSVSWFAVIVTFPLLFINFGSRVDFVIKKLQVIKEAPEPAFKNKVPSIILLIFILSAVFLLSFFHSYIGTSPRNSYNNFERHIAMSVIITAYFIYMFIFVTFIFFKNKFRLKK